MRAFMASVAAILILALGVAVTLDSVWQKRAAEAFTTGGARIADPGDNLVGKDWYRGNRS